MKKCGLEIIQTKNRSLLGFLFIMVFLLAETGFSQNRERFAAEFEGGLLWQTRNDVRIPNSTGTEFSIVDAIGSGAYGNFRVEVAFDLNERHGFRAIIAPVSIEDSTIFDSSVSFAGQTFDPGINTIANYKFSSYRFTYRYRFYNGPTWSWKIGFTGFIRDARIALQQGDTFAEDTDVGFVPLAHLRGEARIHENWRFLFDFEGMATPQGRAFDISAKMGYVLSDHWELDFGYRMIEGGADVEQVYNFAWLHFAVASIRFRY